MKFRWLIALCVIFACGLVGADTSLHLVQQQRITQAQAAAASQRAEDRADYDALLSKYSKLYDQLVTAGETPSQPAPEAVKGDTGATGPVGPKGDPGQNATDTQVAAAVVDYCAAHGGCIGAPGQTGAAGSDGVDGSPGVAGPVGPAGPSGPSGVSVTGVSCVRTDTGTVFEFTFSDGTTHDVAGNCRP